jgi:NhaP-type Na+/H+ or K+/H+ antiporter
MRLPSRVRQSLNVESGLNDGICVPLLFIALAIAETEQKAVGGGHATRIVVEEIGYGIVGGVAAGLGGALVLRFASKHGLADEIWARLIPVAAAALAYGIAAPLGGSGFIAAFVGGLVYGIVRGTGELATPESSSVMDAAAEVFAALTFIGFGSVALGWALHRVDWKVVLYAVLSLTAIRMLPVAIAFVGTGAKRETVAFAGWFGPRGLASIVFAVLVIEESALAHAELLITVSFITIALSVLAHGMTAVPLTNAYVRWMSARPPAVTEQVAVHEHPWRRPDHPRTRP